MSTEYVRPNLPATVQSYLRWRRHRERRRLNRLRSLVRAARYWISARVLGGSIAELYREIGRD